MKRNTKRLITLIFAIFVLNYTYVFSASNPIINIRVNGLANQVTINPSSVLSVKVDIDPGSLLGSNADWWVVAQTPTGDWYSWVYPTGWNKSGIDLSRISVAYQGSLFTLPPYEVLNTTNLPQGNYSIYFGVDTSMNGILDYPSSSLYYAMINLTVSSSSTQWRGVNISGAEFGESHLPGVYGNDYIYPVVTEVDYFKNIGMNIVRLPFRWERLQPTLNQPFDTAELVRLQTFVSGVTAKGVNVLLDPQNFARYQGQVIGSSGVPNAAFADFWSRLSVLFKDNNKVLFGLMNEPHDMPTETWVSAANAAIQSIRASNATNTIMVSGNGWDGAWNWSQNYYGTPNADAMKAIVDPVNNIVFEVHQYLDTDSSGTSPICVSATIGVERLTNFTNWLRTNSKRGFLGEFAGANNDICNQAVSNMLNYVVANSDVWLGWAWWSAGPWWGNYMFSIEPGSDGSDKPQILLLQPYLH